MIFFSTKIFVIISWIIYTKTNEYIELPMFNQNWHCKKCISSLIHCIRKHSSTFYSIKLCKTPRFTFFKFCMFRTWYLVSVFFQTFSVSIKRIWSYFKLQFSIRSILLELKLQITIVYSVSYKTFWNWNMKLEFLVCPCFIVLVASNT